MPGLSIVVPAAGRGQRFREIGIETPKPLIRFARTGADAAPRRSMLEHAISGAPEAVQILVGCPADQHDQFSEALEGAPCTRVVPIRKTTGQADTVLQLLDQTVALNQVLVVNSDQGFKGHLLDLLCRSGHHDPQAQHALFTFDSTDPRFSYVDRIPRFSLAAEKRVISTHAIAGAYWFACAYDLYRILHEHVQGPTDHAGEHYLSGALEAFAFRHGSGLALPLALGALLSWGTPEQLLADREACSFDEEVARRLRAHDLTRRLP